VNFDPIVFQLAFLLCSAHEAVLCGEVGLPYALICMVDNMANGVTTDKLSLEIFRAGLLLFIARYDTLMIEFLAKFAVVLLQLLRKMRNS
jgi:hypothetical protein